MSGSDRSRTPRSSTSTAERLTESARQLLAHATLDDLAEFVSVRRLIESTELSSGAVYSSFAPAAGIGARTRSAPQVAARAAFDSLSVDSDELVADVLSLLDDVAVRGAAEGVDFLVPIAELLARPVVNAARGDEGDHGWTYTHLFLGAAVSLNDPEVAALLARSYLGAERAYVPALEVLMRLTDRVLVDGIDIHQLSRMLVGAGDACALRIRVEPDVDPSVLTWMYVAVWSAMTRRADDRDDQIVRRLAIHGQSPLSAEETDHVRAAVLRVSGRAGWPAVTLAKVAQLSGVSDARLAGEYSSRHALSPFVWEAVVDGIVRRDAARVGLAAGRRLAALLEDLCDVACSQRALTASLLIAHLDATSADLAEANAPGSELIVDLVASAVRASSAEIAGEVTDPSPRFAAGDGFRVMARATLDLVLLRASRSAMTGGDLARMVIDGMAGAGVIGRNTGQVDGTGQ